MAIPDSPGSSIRSVLDTYELLETILACLPIKDLFIVQRVDRAWRSVIERSRGIRRSMFLHADSFIPPDTDSYIRADTDLDDFIKPPSSHRVYRGCVRFNPAFEFVHLRYPEEECIGWASFRVYPSETMLLIGVTIRKQVDLQGAGPFFIPDATCKNIFVTQPPVTAMGFDAPEFSKFTVDGTGNFCDVYNPQGITFGDLSTVRDKVIRAWEKQTGKKHRFLDTFGFLLRLSPKHGARMGKFGQCSVPESERKGGCMCVKTLLEVQAPSFDL